MSAALSTSPLALAAANQHPDHSRLAAHERFAAILGEVCDDEGGTIRPELCAVDDGWQPLFANNDELFQALETTRDDGRENLATALTLVTMTPTQLRAFVGSLDMDAADNLLSCLAEYRGRVVALREAVECSFGRIFAACYERHGLPARPTLSVVGA